MLLQRRIRFHKDEPRSHSVAIADYGATRLGREYALPENLPAIWSGMSLLPDGKDAFAARLVSADRAERSLDVQYFIWENDRVGRVLLARLLAAAERGVRVRLLLDDIHNTGRDFSLATLDAHPNIQVRIFNPFGKRQRWSARALELLGNFSRLNHRMHNKAWIGDNAVAIVGGRNIGAHYFGVHSDTNFRDLDLLVTGPAVRTISSAFDSFWNSEWAVPIGALVLLRPKMERARRMARVLTRYVERRRQFPLPLRFADEEPAPFADRRIYAPAMVVWDDPAKVVEPQWEIWKHLVGLVAKTRQECMLESAYFVPSARGLEHLAQAVARGVRVRVLTNSLASTDVLVAHAGYARMRPALLASGVELHELRPDSHTFWRLRFRRRGRAALHAKAGVFDCRKVLIGSFNFDMRSTLINTELALIIDSPELAGQLLLLMDRGVRPEHSWQVTLSEGTLCWEGRHRGRKELRYHEPKAGLWRRVASWMLSLLPLENQL